MERSLLALYPNIAAEWHPTRNGDLKPSGVAAHSNRYVWWQCVFGHEWEAKINNRTSSLSACPYCGRKKTIKGENDFAHLFPTLLEEWDFEVNTIDPSTIFPQSNKKVAWKCAEGHAWLARVDHRVNGENCPVCNGQKPDVGKTDLQTLYPDIAALWDVEKNGNLLPVDFLPFSHHQSHWKCPKGHEWKSAICIVVRSYQRNPGRTGCPVCSGKVVHPDNCLAAVAPQLAAEWDDENERTPFEVTLHSNIRARWKCSVCGHRWESKVNNRAQGTGCPACKHFIATRENNLIILAPSLAEEWDAEKNELTADNIAACSNLSYWWKCKEGHEWKATVSNRYLLGYGCPQCAKRVVIVGETDLATVRSELIPEWDIARNAPLEPTMVTAFSNWKVYWKCPNGHSYRSAIASRSYGSECPICNGRRQYRRKFST